MPASPSKADSLPSRSRGRLLALAVGTVLLGLLSRRYPVAGNYPGDALWASLVFTLWVFLLPRRDLKLHATLAAATSLCVEFSQLYRAPWIDSIRQTLPGRLVLGSGFDPLDLVAYSVGCLLGFFIVLIAIPSNPRS